MSYILKTECRTGAVWGPHATMLYKLLGEKPPPRPWWVAKITGYCPKFKYKREFVRGKTDYTYANSTGSRGVYIYYVLENGKLYQVKQFKVDPYFCTVVGNELIKLTKEEVDKWLSDTLTPMSSPPPENA